jgi:hypothetical protein
LAKHGGMKNFAFFQCFFAPTFDSAWLCAEKEINHVR